MTETARRRQDLLTQTRRIYKDGDGVPAVHPRYGNIYHNLYDSPPTKQSPKEATNHSLYIRFICALLIFALYACIDLQGVSIGNYSSNEIVEAVSQNILVEKLGDSW